MQQHITKCRIQKFYRMFQEVEKFSLPQQDELDRDAMHRLAAHKMYFKLAFEPYGGVAGMMKNACYSSVLQYISLN